MKRKGLWIGLGAVALAAVVLIAILFQPWKLFTNTEVVEANPFSSAAATGSNASSGVLANGSFQGRAHETTGTAKIGTTPDGKPVVFLDNLATDNGPDLKLYLSPSANGEINGGINLGDLKGNKGSQTYTIPPGTETTKYKSVVIWCERFSVAFGVAPLSTS